MTPDSDNNFMSHMIFVNENHGILDKMRDFFKQDILTDVVLKSGDEEIKCHRLVLSASCRYFAAMFNSNMRESSEEVVQINGVEGPILSAIVNYFYSGTLEINESNVDAILSVSSMFLLDEVIAACSEFLEKKLHCGNAVEIFLFADRHSCAQLKQAAEARILENFSIVSAEWIFRGLSDTVLATILASDRLRLDSEDDAYKALKTWVNSDFENRKDKMEALLKHIKLPLITKQYFLDNVVTDSLVMSNKLVTDAIAYHLLPARRSGMPTSQTRPRLSILDQLCVLGGSSSYAKKIEIYDPYEDTWDVSGEMTTRREQFGAGEHNGILYIAGGRVDLKTVKTFESLKVTSEEKEHVFSWTTLPDMGTPRHGLGVAVLAGQVFTVGGHDGWTHLTLLERYDPEFNRWELSASMLNARLLAGVTALDNKLYVVGGRDSQAFLRSGEVYDPVVNMWRPLPYLQKPKAGLGLVALDGCLYAVGGFKEDVKYASVERYDPRENMWHSVAPLSEQRSYVSVVTMGDRLVAIGGHNGTSHSNVAEIYDPVSDSWSRLQPLNVARSSACAFSIKRSPVNTLYTSCPHFIRNQQTRPGTSFSEYRDGICTPRSARSIPLIAPSSLSCRGPFAFSPPCDDH